MPSENGPAASTNASAAAERRERRRHGILANSDDRIKRILTDGDDVRQAPAMEGGDAFRFSFLSENQQPSGNGEASDIKNKYKAWAAESARQQAMIHELESAVQSMARVISNQQAIRYDLHERINRENERLTAAKAEQRRLRHELDENERERARLEEEMKKMQRQRTEHLDSEAQLQRQVSTMKSDLLKLNQELEQRKARVEDLQRDVAARDAELQRTRVDLEQATQQLEAANGKNSQLKTLALQYKKKLEDAKMAPPAGAAGTTGEDIIKQETENATAAASTSSTGADFATPPRTAALIQLQAENEETKRQLAAALKDAEEAKAHYVELEQRQNAITSMASREKQANERCMAAEAEQRRLRYELEEKEHERARFEEEMRKMQRQRSEHLAAEAQLKGQLSTMHSALLKLNQELGQRKARVEQLQGDAELHWNEMAAALQQNETSLLTQTQTERDVLKQEKDAITAKLQAELAKATQELEVANGKNSQLKTLALQYKKKFEAAVRASPQAGAESSKRPAVVSSVSEGSAESVKRFRLEIKQEYEDIRNSECVPNGEDARDAGGRASGLGGNASAQVSRGSRSGITLRGNPRGIGRGREGGAGGKDGNMSM